MKTLIIHQVYTEDCFSKLALVVDGAKQVSNTLDLLLVIEDPQFATLGLSRIPVAINQVCLISETINPVNFATFLFKNYADYSFLCAANTLIEETICRVSAQLNREMITQVSAIENTEGLRRYTRNECAGQVSRELTLKPADPTQVISTPISLSIDLSSYQVAQELTQVAQDILQDEIVYATIKEFKQISLNSSMTANAKMTLARELLTAETHSLTEAKVVIGLGRGILQLQDLSVIEQLAAQLNAAIGGTRSVVDAGVLPHQLQIGQTGQRIAPELYIALGVSGASQHMIGVQNAKRIIAINQDPNAAIFKQADDGFVGDLTSLIPELTEWLTQQ